MAEVDKNKLAAQILKAEMLGDQAKVQKLKNQLANIKTKDDVRQTIHHEREISVPSYSLKGSSSLYESIIHKNDHIRKPTNHRVDKFIKSAGSLSDMFVQEKKLNASDEVKMFLKTSAKFSKEDMETKQFSQEFDDSQKILDHKSKRQRVYGPTRESLQAAVDKPSGVIDQDLCHGCPERIAKHLLIDTQRENIYMCLIAAKPFLSSLSNVVISSKDHSCGSFVSASSEHQEETELLIDILRKAWKTRGYRCLVMETHFRNRRASRREFVSCSNHFRVHCLPIKEKHYERSRMCFKQALQASESEWSMNKKLIQTDGRRIQRYLPKGLSYFWVCFDSLHHGFGHVIENEESFSRYFGLEVLSGLLDKDFNPMKLDQRESFEEQFERCREFKTLYSKFKDQSAE